MRVDFSFNKDIVEANGYTMNDVYGTIKGMFAEQNIACVSDGDVLSFSGGRGKNDFSNMWAIILGLTRTEWFVSFAESCIWYESDDKWEDVLRQAREKKSMRA